MLSKFFDYAQFKFGYKIITVMCKLHHIENSIRALDKREYLVIITDNFC